MANLYTRIGNYQEKVCRNVQVGMEAAPGVACSQYVCSKNRDWGSPTLQSQEKDRTPDGNGDQAFSAWLYLRDRVLSSYKSNSVLKD